MNLFWWKLHRLVLSMPMVALLKGRDCNKCLFPQNGYKENCYNRRKTIGDTEQGQGEGKKSATQIYI